MAFCVQCGAQLPDGAPFCNQCGAAQGSAQPVQQQPQMQQPQMQQPQMQQPQQPQMQQPQMQPQGGGMPYGQQYQQPVQQPQEGGKKKGLIIGLVCGGVALAAGIVVLVLFLTGVFGGEESPEAPYAVDMTQAPTKDNPTTGNSATDEPPVDPGAMPEGLETYYECIYIGGTEAFPPHHGYSLSFSDWPKASLYTSFHQGELTASYAGENRLLLETEEGETLEAYFHESGTLDLTSGTYGLYTFASLESEDYFAYMEALNSYQGPSVSDVPGEWVTPEGAADYAGVLQIFRDALDGKDFTYAVREDDPLSYELSCCLADLSYAEELYGAKDGGYGYVLRDMDMDQYGTKELVIGRNTTGDADAQTESAPSAAEIIAVYTMRDGKAEPVFFGWSRSSYYLKANGFFAHYGSMGATDGYAGEWAIDGTNIVQQGFGVRLYDDGTSGENIYYTLRPGMDLYNLGAADRISQTEYNAYLNRLYADVITLDFQPITAGSGDDVIAEQD